jgi:hypothetical protein
MISCSERPGNQYSESIRYVDNYRPGRSLLTAPADPDIVQDSRPGSKHPRKTTGINRSNYRKKIGLPEDPDFLLIV